ncbi:MAG: glycoside hydrolase family 95 protein [Clostridia bacterium]|nr:glycoside hydrolase family 95 protein [Clostridia bacterium]
MNFTRQSKDSIQLMERSPAACFEQAYPIGNGHQGAVVYGGTENERISLNDDTLWSGYPDPEPFRGDGYESLERAKADILKGDYVGAHTELTRNFGCYASASYMPLGDLHITFGKNANKVSGYRRTLDLKRAVVSASYRRGDVAYTLTAFASHPDDVIVYRLEAREKDGTPAPVISMTAGFNSQLYSKVYTKGGLLYLEGECPVTERQNIGRTERKTQYFDEPEKRGMRFMAIADLITDGKKGDELNAIAVRKATYCEIRIYMATSFNGYDKHPFTDGRDFRGACAAMREAILEKSFEDILRAHVRDHSKFFNRVALDLGSDNKSAVPTSERMRRFEQGVSDRALPALLFNFGRYLTVAASRKGSQATNLQGIWNDKYAAPWDSNYTTNINLEMNYFPTLAIGLPEMYEPLIRLIREVSETGKETARVLYGADGWCCHHNTDLWRFTQPVCGAAHWSFWSLASGWMCHHLMDYYEYTLDKHFLEKTAYPILREAARFYLSQLVTMDGYRVMFPSTSPENTFAVDGVRVAVSETTEMTMAILRELFANYLNVCKILDLEDDITPTVREELPRLLPTRIASDGRVMEWYREKQDYDIRHRHLSQLYGFYPAHAYRPDNAPELCEACRKSIEVKGRQTVGWSLAWRSCLYAALGDGEAAYAYLRDQLHLTDDTIVGYSGGGGSYTNLFGACPPFQIDSNFGITAAIVEMLLQSDMDTVHVIPALPAAWSDVSVRGLRAKGKRKISFTVRGGELVACRIEGGKPKKILVAGKDMTEAFDEKGVFTAKL